MKLKTLFFCLLTFIIHTQVHGQTKPELSLVLLENDNIATVNIDQERFTETLGNIIDVTEEAFKDIDSTQKIAILIIAHTAGKPSIELHSNPQISGERETQFLQLLNAQEVVNTKLVDFPLLIILNSAYEEFADDFPTLITPSEERNQVYVNGDLKTQYQLNKDFALEVLSVLSAYEVIVEDQFVGVKELGALVSKTDFSTDQAIAELSSKNPYYWRAMMEMSVGNQLVPITHIFMLASQGELDHANKYLEIFIGYSDPRSISSKYLYELGDRLDFFIKQLSARIQLGIELHDKGKYEDAIELYSEILEEYPHSAWAKYELYFSQNALALENKTKSLEDASDWNVAKIGIYGSNPLYPISARASNGKESYLLFRRAYISELFQKSENRIKDVYTYADIAMDLEVYEFAAHLFWISMTFDKENNDALNKYLYCLEKLGVTGIKNNFKGDFNKAFKKIEKDKEAEMTENSMFKAFGN